jgi:hypothetical protein
MVFQTNLAGCSKQSKNKHPMVSKELQEQQARLPFKIIFAGLSLVNVTPLKRYQRKILILKGTLIFQSEHFLGITPC